MQHKLLIITLFLIAGLSLLAPAVIKAAGTRPTSASDSTTCQARDTSFFTGSPAAFNTSFWHITTANDTNYRIERINDADTNVSNDWLRIVLLPSPKAKTATYAAVETRQFIEGDFVASATLNAASMTENADTNNRLSDTGMTLHMYQKKGNEVIPTVVFSASFARDHKDRLLYRLRTFNPTKGEVMDDNLPLFINEDEFQTRNARFEVTKKCTEKECTMQFSVQESPADGGQRFVKTVYFTQKTYPLTHSLLNFRVYRERAATPNPNAVIDGYWSNFTLGC